MDIYFVGDRSMSILKVQQLQHTNGTVGLDIHTSGTVHIPGHVIQTVYNEHITGTAYTSSNTSHDLFSASITPKIATSKILVSMSVTHGTHNTQNDFGLHLKRGSTRIGGRTNDVARGGANTWYSGDDPIGVTGGANLSWNLFIASWQYLDSPNTTSSTTYTVGLYVHNYFYLNRYSGGNNAGGSSYISLQEIAQ